MADRDDILSLPLLEAVHTFTDQYGNVVKLHDPQGAFPRMKCHAINGLRGRADIDLNADPYVGRTGELVRPSFLRGKTVTYEGDAGQVSGIQAKTLESLRLFQGQLSGRFGWPGEARIDIDPHVSYGGNAYFYKARVSAWDPDESQSLGPDSMPSPWLRSFVLALRMHDPRIYLDVATTVASAAASGANEPSLVITPGGSADTNPIFRIYGPIVNPRLYHALGATLAFDGVNLAAGQYMAIDFSDRAVRYQDGTDWGYKFDEPNSNWWDPGVMGLLPTANTVTLKTAVGKPGAGSYFQATYNPAIWG